MLNHGQPFEHMKGKWKEIYEHKEHIIQLNLYTNCTDTTRKPTQPCGSEEQEEEEEERGEVKPWPLPSSNNVYIKYLQDEEL